MQTTNTSVLARSRVWIKDDYATKPYEAGWATEAALFTQAARDHPDLTVSPDGIKRIRRGTPVVLAAAHSLALPRGHGSQINGAGSDPHPPQPQGLSG